MDRDRVRSFMLRFMEMTTGAATLGVVALADRTGLFQLLAGQGPLTLEQIAERSGLQERYVEEALAALAAAGVLVYEDADATYELPDEHATCLADESSPYFLCGWTQILPAMYRVLPQLERAFREGGGVPYAEFGEEMVAGISRANSPGMRVLLTRRWLPALPELVARLEQGIRVADVGCGSGTAAITMARAYPRSTFIGIDADAASIARARSAAQEAELANVAFEQIAVADLPEEPGFDFVTSFDVIHDLADPAGALARIRGALREEGTYLMVEPAAEDTLAENLNPAGALAYAMSTLHCTTVSLAQGGVGLGTAWGGRRAEALCREAGFCHFRRVEIENPFNAFYEVRA